MKPLLRTIAAILAALVVVFVLVIAVEAFSAVVHPLPEDFGNTAEEMCAHVERYPAWVLAVVVPIWAVAAFIGTWTAKKLGNLTAAAIVGLLVIVAVAANVAMLPYPAWFKIACLLAIPAAAFAATGLPLRWNSPRDDNQVPAA